MLHCFSKVMFGFHGSQWNPTSICLASRVCGNNAIYMIYNTHAFFQEFKISHLYL